MLTGTVAGCGPAETQPAIPDAPLVDVQEDTSIPAPEPSPEPASEQTPEPEPEPEPTGNSLSIIGTIFPQYDWTRQILGERSGHMDLILLQDTRVDLHNFQPSVRDMVTISSCDLFIYVGGDSDFWVEDVLRQAANPDMIVINLLELLGDAALLEDELDHDDHHHHHHHHTGDDDELEFDEHVWLSLKNAVIFCSAIADALSVLDPEFSTVYSANLTSYIDELNDLDAEYATILDGLPNRILLFGDRFPFRYLIEDYGLEYYAAFSGCSAETEASFQTIVFLARRMDEHNLRNIMVTESSDQSIARTVIDSSSAGDQNILVLDSMQSVTADDVQSGVTYISIMQNNLQVLKNALA